MLAVCNSVCFRPAWIMYNWTILFLYLIAPLLSFLHARFPCPSPTKCHCYCWYRRTRQCDWQSHVNQARHGNTSCRIWIMRVWYIEINSLKCRSTFKSAGIPCIWQLPVAAGAFPPGLVYLRTTSTVKYEIDVLFEPITPTKHKSTAPPRVFPGSCHYTKV